MAAGRDVAVRAAAPRAETGLERYRLAHRGLPGRDLAETGLATPLLGAVLAAPLLISAPAGAGPIGRLARAASEHGLGLVVGGGGELLEDPGRIGRYHAPDRPPLLLAAIGLTDLLDGDGPERAERLAGMLDADGLVVELDVIGAATEPGGDPRARRALSAIAAVVRRLAPLPVVAREAGSGMDGADARALQAAGVAALDVGGAGARDRDDGAFAGWGVPVADAVAEAALMAPGLSVIAGGPLRDGVEVACCPALGAVAACLERPFAPASSTGGPPGAPLGATASQAARSTGGPPGAPLGATASQAARSTGGPPGAPLGATASPAASATAAAIVHQLRVAVWAAGAPNAAALGPGHLRVRGLT